MARRGGDAAPRERLHEAPLRPTSRGARGEHAHGSACRAGTAARPRPRARLPPIRSRRWRRSRPAPWANAPAPAAPDARSASACPRARRCGADRPRGRTGRARPGRRAGSGAAQARRQSRSPRARRHSPPMPKVSRRLAGERWLRAQRQFHARRSACVELLLGALAGFVLLLLGALDQIAHHRRAETVAEGESRLARIAADMKALDMRLEASREAAGKLGRAVTRGAAAGGIENRVNAHRSPGRP